MPKRPRQHLLEDLAKGQIIEIFSSYGWNVENLSQDYGEDFSVRIFEDEKATPYSFYVQSKSTDNIDKYKLNKIDGFSIPINSEHLKNWIEFQYPVILTLFDGKTKEIYWESVQLFLENNKIEKKHLTNKTYSIRILRKNKIDEIGVNKIHYITKNRIDRLKHQIEGATTLVGAIKEFWNVEIEYEPLESSIILPKGKFIPSEDKRYIIIPFGRSRHDLERKKWILEGNLFEEYFIRILEMMEKIEKAFKSDRKNDLNELDLSFLEKSAAIKIDKDIRDSQTFEEIREKFHDWDP